MSNLFEQMGFDSHESRILEMKTQAYRQIKKIVEKQGYTQKYLAEKFDVTQPRVSELLHGKLSLFSLEKLLGFVELLGYRTDMQFKKVANG